MKEQEKIDRRLLNQMSKAEQEAFDKELASNPDLADSFDFNQDMADFFANENSPLEGQLNALGDKHFSKKSTPNNRKKWFWFLPMLLLSGAILSYFFFNTTHDETASPSDVKIESPASGNLSPVIEKEKEIEIIPTEEKQEDIKEEKKEEVIPDFYSPPTEEEKSAPIAALNPADFEINSALEGLFRENVRDTKVTNITKPSNEEILEVSSNLFALQGTTTNKPPFQLAIYSNRSFDFDNDYPVFRQEISANKNGDEFIIDFNAKLSFVPGLYYLILQNDKAELMSISKFMVK